MPARKTQPCLPKRVRSVEIGSDLCCGTSGCAKLLKVNTATNCYRFSSKRARSIWHLKYKLSHHRKASARRSISPRRLRTNRKIRRVNLRIAILKAKMKKSSSTSKVRPRNWRAQRHKLTFSPGSAYKSELTVLRFCYSSRTR